MPTSAQQPASRKPPRVVILDDQITPYRIPLFQSLSRKDLDLRVVYCTRRLRGPDWWAPTPVGFQFETLPTVVIRLRKRPYGEPRPILLTPTLPLRLVSLRPDVVIGYAFSVPTWIAFLYARIFGKAFISWSSDTSYTERNLSGVQRWIRRQIIPRADRCIAPSEAGRRRYVSYQADPSRVHVAVQASALTRTWPGADPPPHSAPEPSSLRARPIVLYVGSLSERKGVEYLLQAFLEVRRVSPDVELVLVGSGEMETRLREIAAANGLQGAIHFEGQVSYEGLAAYYSRAALFVLPSLEDTFGMVVAEAAEFGLPLVVSKFSGAADEFVRAGENGFVIDPTETGALAAAILNILQDEGRRKRMGAISLQISETKTLDHSAEEFALAIHRAAIQWERGRRA